MSWKKRVRNCLTDRKWQELRSVAHLFPIREISPPRHSLSHFLWIVSQTCHFCMTETKVRPNLIPPSALQTWCSFKSAPKDSHPKKHSPDPHSPPPFCLQWRVPVAQTQTRWWQRKGDVIRRLTTAAHFTTIINICTWVWGCKCKRNSGFGLGGRSHWFWLNLVPISPNAGHMWTSHGLLRYHKQEYAHKNSIKTFSPIKRILLFYCQMHGLVSESHIIVKLQMVN